jgi:predicted SprT family Zn-dependent metalloprotease
VNLRLAFNFLKNAAFHDIPLPRLTLTRKPLRKAWGYYYDSHKIEIASDIKTGDKLLKVLAHEMCHAALEQNADSDHHQHDANFDALAAIICERMGWSKRGF